MNFITVNNGVVTGFFTGDINCDLSHTEYAGHERIALTDQVVTVGEPVSYYSKNWKRYTDKYLVSKEILSLPKGYKLGDDDMIRAMNTDELILAGIIPPKTSRDVVDVIDTRTPSEKLEAGVINKDEYEELEKKAKIEKIHTELSKVDASISQRTLMEATLGDEFAIDLIKKAQEKAKKLRKELAEIS